MRTTGDPIACFTIHEPCRRGRPEGRGEGGGRMGMREGGGRDARRDIAMMVRCYGILFSISENPEAGRKPACSLHTLLQEVN